MNWDEESVDEETDQSSWSEEHLPRRSASHFSTTDYAHSSELLTAAEEIDLVRKAHAGDLSARNRMIESNIRLVISIARRFSCRSMTLEDLIQEGVFGLVEAVRKFDVSLGYRFSTYATYWIRQGIVRAMEKQDRMIRLPSYGCNAEHKINQAKSNLHNVLGRDATIEEIAIETGLSRRLIRMLQDVTHEPVSLDTLLGPYRDTRLLEMQPNADLVEPEDQAIQQIDRSALLQLVNRLSVREALVIQKRFGLSDGRIYSLHEISTELGMSREGVRHIQNRALRALRQMLKVQEPEEYDED